MSVFHWPVQRELETGEIGFNNQFHLVFEIHCVFPTDSPVLHTQPHVASASVLEGVGVEHREFGLCDISPVDFFLFSLISSFLFVKMPDLRKSWERRSEYPKQPSPRFRSAKALPYLFSVCLPPFFALNGTI